MRAAIARNGQLRIDDMTDPTPGPGEALVRVAACGICGSDLHALRYADQLVAITVDAGMPAMFDPSRDYVMGHEFTAEVLELGAGDRRRRRSPSGDLVVLAAGCADGDRNRSRSARIPTSTTAATPS